MRFLSKLFSLFVAAAFAGTIYAAEPVPASSDYMFAPEGFDDNDNVQVVLDGWLSSSCDRAVEPKVVVHPEKQVIELSAQVVHGDFLCLPVMVRFTSVADIGPLPWGKWSLVTNNGWLVDELIIDEASNAGPDDHVYAAVDEAHVEYIPDLKDADSKWSVVLLGHFQNSCQSFDEIKVIDSGDTVEVLPILKVQDRGQECLQVITPYNMRAFLPDYEVEGRHLLHVRSRGGEALNKVFSVHTY